MPSPHRSSGIYGYHLVRYGTAADQKYLVDSFIGTYDQLIINAKMLAHIPAALASFLSQRAKNKPYFIDPQTHAFQHDLSHLESKSPNAPPGQLAKSVLKLVEAYGDPVRKRATAGQSVLPSDFKKTGVDGFCDRVLDFQNTTIRTETEESEDAKYFQFLAKKTTLSNLSTGPSLLVAPYFYLPPTTYPQWLDVNVACLLAAKTRAKTLGRPVAAQIVLAQQLLFDEQALRLIVDAYGRAGPSTVLLWIDAFDEHSASEQQLVRYVQLLQNLAELAPVVDLYGSYFTVALGRAGAIENLAGVAHSLEYGEERAVVPVGGGIPVAKYYLPALHSRLPFRDALRAIRALGGFGSTGAFHQRICNCPECRAVIHSNPLEDFGIYGRTRPISFTRGAQLVGREFPLTETKEHTVRHYMWSRAREYAEQTNLDEIALSLAKIGKQLERALGSGTVDHCQTWSRVLEKYA